MRDTIPHVLDSQNSGTRDDGDSVPFSLRGAEARAIRPSRIVAHDSPDHGARLSTRWYLQKSVRSSRPRARRQLATVREPGHSRPPVTRTRTLTQVGLVKQVASGDIARKGPQSASMAEVVVHFA